jgi:hypothetical protein
MNCETESYQTGVAVLELIACTWAFWHKTGARFCADNPKTTTGSSTSQALKSKVTIICALYFLAYVGAEGMPRHRSMHISIIAD